MIEVSSEVKKSPEKSSPRNTNLLVENFASLLMVGFENSRDLVDNPEVYGLNSGNVSQSPLVDSPEGWIFSHIGNVFETAVTFSATRLSLALVDHLLKKATKDKVSIPDEVGFWLSLAIGTLIPSLIELNQTLPFNLMPSYQGDPADLFGVGVAAVVLIASHYSKDILQKIKNGQETKDKSKKNV